MDEPIFSSSWTDEDRLKAIVFLAQVIQSDIPAGKYGAVTAVGTNGLPRSFRPNMQSIINVALAEPDELELARSSLEEFMRSELSPERIVEFRKSLGQARRERR